MHLFKNLLAAPDHRIAERSRELPAGKLNVRLAEGVDMGAARRSPAQLQGRRYEARVRRFLKPRIAALGWDLWDHQWIEYGYRHLAQPDFVLIRPDSSAILLECKLTWTDCSEQLDLYSILLRELGLDPLPCVVCKNLTPNATGTRVRRLEDIKSHSLWQLRL